MKRNLSKFLALLLTLTLVLTSALAVYADNTELSGGNEPSGDIETSGEMLAPVYYTVTFTDGQGNTLSTEEVESGQAAAAPADPVRDGYDFAGWDADFDVVTADIVVNALWTEKPHVHSWSAWKVTVKQTYLKNGTKVRTCSECGETETQPIAKKTAKNKWIKEGGKWYYFGSNSKLYVSWHKMKMRGSKKVKWLYFNRGGAYVKSISKNTKKKWVKAGGYKFYFTKKKKPAGAGFNTINKKLYHMDKYGAVMYGTFKAADGKTYTTDSSGVISGASYYLNKYKTFVLIDISQQTLWYYKGGKLKLKADVVTGTKGKHNTPTGIFKVRSKQKNIYLNGATWRSHVDYWMAFIGSSHGMHDATWRSSKQFSNHKTYLKNGSHGCVNMRHKDAKKLFGMISVGTKVIVQK